MYVSQKVYKDLFYRCRFSQIADELGTERQDAVHAISPQKLSDKLYLASSYYELKQDGKAGRCLASTATALEQAGQSNYLYALARLAYLDGDQAKAYEMFLKCSRNSKDSQVVFRSKLGMANVLFSLDRLNLVTKLLAELQNHDHPIEADDQISLEIFLGNFHREHHKDYSNSLSHYRRAMRIACKYQWPYFIHRIFLGIASVHLLEKNYTALTETVQNLEDFLEHSEDQRILDIIQQRFSKFTALGKGLELDPDHLRIKFGDIWMEFQDKPLLFQFFETLSREEKFHKKQELAETLWPEQSYRPRTHDPRIFDIAKRAKEITKQLPSAQIVSGRMGYKLAASYA